MALLFLEGFAHATTAQFAKLAQSGIAAATALRRWRRVLRKNTRRRRGTHRQRVGGKRR